MAAPLACRSARRPGLVFPRFYWSGVPMAVELSVIAR